MVGDIRVTSRRGVHLLFQHSLIDRRYRPLRSAVDEAVDGRGRHEGEFGHGLAHASVDSLGAPGRLIARTWFAVATFGRAVRVADGHSNDDDGMRE